jgi:hypothetical protein
LFSLRHQLSCCLLCHDLLLAVRTRLGVARPRLFVIGVGLMCHVWTSKALLAIRGSVAGPAALRPIVMHVAAQQARGEQQSTDGYE